MKLRNITEIAGFDSTFSRLLGDSDPVAKLIRWSLSRHNFTDPGELHTSGVIRHELLTGRRLVGNPWKTDCILEDFDGFQIVDYDKQLMVALPENRDVLDLVVTSSGTKTHLIRGLAFGYEPSSVLKFYKAKEPGVIWRKHLKSLGIKTSADYETGGYSSSAKDNGGCVIVEPGDVDQVERNIANLGKLRWVRRWCPDCDRYVVIKGMDFLASRDPYFDDSYSTTCTHEPKHTPEATPASHRHWFYYYFEPRGDGGDE